MFLPSDLLSKDCIELVAMELTCIVFTSQLGYFTVGVEGSWLVILVVFGAVCMSCMHTLYRSILANLFSINRFVSAIEWRIDFLCYIYIYIENLFTILSHLQTDLYICIYICIYIYMYIYIYIYIESTCWYCHLSISVCFIFVFISEIAFAWILCTSISHRHHPYSFRVELSLGCWWHI